MNRSILIVGGEGLLGSALLAHGREQGLTMQATMLQPPAASPGIHPLDLREPLDAWQTPRDCRAAILCSAITSLETCRRDPAGTRLINVTQTVRLAEKLLSNGIFVLFISSNLVFDGTRPAVPADEPTRPMTEYGRHKAEVEAALGGLGGSVAIVRLTKVVNPQWPLLCGWQAALRGGQPVRAFDDMVCAPISLKLAVRGLTEVADGMLPGIWQFSAEADVSYADIARHFARRLKVDSSLVQPVSSRENAAVEHAPQHTTLDATRARRELGLEFPPAANLIDAEFFP